MYVCMYVCMYACMNIHSNTGHDAGGFAGAKPDPELFVRWLQNAIFHPRFCVHSWNEDNTVNELWMYPQVLDLVKHLVRLRYRLIPYLYSLLYRYSRYGTPVLRPLVTHFPQDPACWDESFHFLFGPSVLVASVVESEQTCKDVYLPQSSECKYVTLRYVTFRFVSFLFSQIASFRRNKN